MSPRYDSNRTVEAKTESIIRRTTRKTYAMNGGRF